MVTVSILDVAIIIIGYLPKRWLRMPVLSAELSTHPGRAGDNSVRTWGPCFLLAHPAAESWVGGQERVLTS